MWVRTSRSAAGDDWCQGRSKSEPPGRRKRGPVQAGQSGIQFAFWGRLERSYVSLMERGIKSPTVRMVFRLAGILGVTAAELVGRTEKVMGIKPPEPGSGFSR